MSPRDDTPHPSARLRPGRAVRGMSAVLLPFPPLFADGFESGDTSAWSSTVP